MGSVAIFCAYEIYFCLRRELIEDANYNHDPSMLGMVGIAPATISELEMYYSHQTTTKCHYIDSRVKSLVSKLDPCSLFNRIQTQLVDVLRDINKGPMFAYRMLSSSEAHNLINIIDGLITENNLIWVQEAAQADLRYSDYINSKDDFSNRKRRNLFDNDKKRYKDCEYYLMLLEQHKLNIHVLSKLDSVLKELRNQIVGKRKIIRRIVLP